MLLLNLIQVRESISGSVVPLAMFVLNVFNLFVLLFLCWHPYPDTKYKVGLGTISANRINAKSFVSQI